MSRLEFASHANRTKVIIVSDDCDGGGYCAAEIRLIDTEDRTQDREIHLDLGEVTLIQHALTRASIKWSQQDGRG